MSHGVIPSWAPPNAPSPVPLPFAGQAPPGPARRSLGWVGWLCIGVVLASAPAGAQVDILTNRYDPQRTGANLAETVLTAGNVNAARFGKLVLVPG